MRCPHRLRLFGPLTFILSLIVIPLYGQNLPGQHPQSQQHKNMKVQSQSQQETISVLGIIKRSAGKIVIEDPSTSVSYIVDNPSTVESYLGKNVRVTGVLDLTANTIHILSVQPGS